MMQLVPRLGVAGSVKDEPSTVITSMFCAVYVFHGHRWCASFHIGYIVTSFSSQLTSYLIIFM